MGRVEDRREEKGRTQLAGRCRRKALEEAPSFKRADLALSEHIEAGLGWAAARFHSKSTSGDVTLLEPRSLAPWTEMYFHPLPHSPLPYGRGGWWA